MKTLLFSTSYNVPTILENLNKMGLTYRECGTLLTHYPLWSTVRVYLTTPHGEGTSICHLGWLWAALQIEPWEPSPIFSPRNKVGQVLTNSLTLIHSCCQTTNRWVLTHSYACHKKGMGWDLTVWLSTNMCVSVPSQDLDFYQLLILENKKFINVADNIFNHDNTNH